MKRLPTAILVFAVLAAASVLWLQPSIGQPVPKTVKAALPFGLAGDGRTDDADALQRAVDSGVGSIHLPKGDFLIGKTIVVNLDRTGYTAFTGDGTAKIIMSGAGPAIRFVGTHDGTADPASFKPAVWDRQRTPMVQGIEIVGTNELADGIEAEGTMQLTIIGAVIRQVRHGIHLVRRNRNVLISSCHIYQNRGIGVFYDRVNLHQSNILDGISAQSARPRLAGNRGRPERIRTKPRLLVREKPHLQKCPAVQGLRRLHVDGPTCP